MNHTIRIHSPGGPEQLCWDALPDPPAPGPGQVRVRHTAIGVNFLDTYHRSGLYPLPSLPHAIGAEAAGVVEAVGPAVEDLQAGDRVGYATTGPGAYCERRLVAADKLVPLPPWLDDRTAAAMLLKGMTAEYLVRRTFAVQAGMRVLLHAAAGGVGLLACQWLRHLGAVVFGTVGSKAKAALAAEHGCTHPIVYTEEDFVARVRDLTDGAGVHVVYDSVGKTTLQGSLDCLARRGMLVSFGNASGLPDSVNPLELGRRGSLFLTRPSLFDYCSTRSELRASAAALFDVVHAKAVRVRIEAEFPLQEAAAAHRLLESRRSTGAIVLIP
jgi:NADPH:quinone reductase